jgi:hypothetical protein
MSKTYNLVCVDCKEKIWIGQGGVIYDPEKYGLDLFLHKHEEHNLMFVDDEHPYAYLNKYKEVIAERKLVEEK